MKKVYVAIIETHTHRRERYFDSIQARRQYVDAINAAAEAEGRTLHAYTDGAFWADEKDFVRGGVIHAPVILELLQEEQANPFCDPDRANNGGGYDQPVITAKVVGSEDQVVIEDTSCGDFGSRISISAFGKSCYYGSMLPEEQCYSTFQDNDWALLAAVHDFLGYPGYTASDFEAVA